MVLDSLPSSPLTGCRAHLIAGTAGQLKTLGDLARKTGFRRVTEGMPARQPSDALAVTYYFFHYQLDDERLRAALAAIREHEDPSTRFAPAIMIIGQASATDVLRMVGQGFDDIVALPEKAPILEKRFALQVNAPIMYYETDSYFGPDRRRLQKLLRPEADLRQAGTYQHRRYTIKRVPNAGVQILSRQVITTVAPPPPPPRPVQLNLFE
jgi:hypothetical protein